MLLPRERKRIEAMAYFTAVFEANIATNPDTEENRYWFDGLRYAVELGKPLYILNERGHPVPSPLLEGADVQEVFEYDGPVGSRSFNRAVEKAKRSIAGRRGVDRIPVDEEGAGTDPGLS